MGHALIEKYREKNTPHHARGYILVGIIIIIVFSYKEIYRNFVIVGFHYYWSCWLKNDSFESFEDVLCPRMQCVM